MHDQERAAWLLAILVQPRQIRAQVEDDTGAEDVRQERCDHREHSDRRGRDGDQRYRGGALEDAPLFV